jgi:hypothetical protein
MSARSPGNESLSLAGDLLLLAVIAALAAGP